MPTVRVRGTTARQTKARILLDMEERRARKKFELQADRHVLLVPSQQYGQDNNRTRYEVVLDDEYNVVHGTCPDAYYRHPMGGCKHLIAARTWLRRHSLRV